MANTAPAVMIPLKLQLDEVQGQLNNLKQKINKTVDPDTAAYKQLINILGKAENSFINISAASREAFHSEADINKFKKQIQTLMTTLNSLGIKFETLNFKDLGLKDTPELENFKKQLEIVQERIKSLKAQKIGDIFDDDMGKPIKELAKSLDIKMNKNTGFDKLITDFDNAAKAAKKSVSDQTIALEDLEDQIKQFNDQELINLAEQFKKNSALNDVVTDSLDFETIRRNFVQRFTEAFGSTDFSEILKQALDSTENVNSIEYLDNIIEAVKTSKAELVTRREEWEAELERLQAKSEEVEAANKTVKTTIEAQSSEANITSLTNQISALSQKVKELERFLTSEAKTQANVNKEINKASASFSKMGDEINSASHQLRELTEAQERISNIKSAIKNWLGFSEVVNITKNALRDAFNNIKELDATMTQIAVVTDMSQSELWDQVSTYSAIAKQYGATTQGVYEVSQLYYQQGLDTASVMELTTETLKLATIANVDYADATDYMTVAIRGFKMEMTDAQNVVDVYSNLAAVTASDVEELAVAMSKTASSAEAVGASFENTSAMIALMVETTREAPQNIGSAVKSIISRYGEMTTDPTKLVDSEGEELSLNKVDKALKSIGISLQDTNGQFRNFDDVILELASKWDTLDTNAQRYIATVMAGNRQQSRFLAMVGNYERLAELTEEAANSEDAALIQQLKTMDSLQAKMNQLKVTFQEFYTSTGVEDLIKWTVDGITNIISRLNDMPKVFGKLPVAAITTVARIVNAIKAAGQGLGPKVVQWFTTIKNNSVPIGFALGKEYGEKIAEGIRSQTDEIQKAQEDALRSVKRKKNTKSKANSRREEREREKEERRQKRASFFDIAGTGISALSYTVSNDEWGQRLSGFGDIMSGGARIAINSADITAWISMISGAANVIDSWYLTLEENSEKLKKEAEEASNQALVSKNDLSTLEDYRKKYEELSKSQYNSKEAQQDFINLQNEMAEKYPELLSYVDEEGNSIIDLAQSYEILYNNKKKAYEENFLAKQKAQLALLSDPYSQYSTGVSNIFEGKTDASFWSSVKTFVGDGLQVLAGKAIQGITGQTLPFYENAAKNLDLQFAYADTINTLNPILQQSGYDKERFKELFNNSLYGSILDIETIEDLLSGEYDLSTLSEDNRKMLQSFVYVYRSLDNYNKQLNDYMESAFSEAIDFYLPEESPLQNYSLLKDQINEQLQKSWDTERERLLQQGYTLDQAREEFFWSIEENIISIADELSNNFNIENSNNNLKQAEEIYSKAIKYSYDYLTNLPEEIIQYLTEEQQTELVEEAQKRLDFAQKAITGYIQSAIESGNIDALEGYRLNNTDSVISQALEKVSGDYADEYGNILNSFLSSSSYVDSSRTNLALDFASYVNTLLSTYTEESQKRAIESIIFTNDYQSFDGLFTIEEELNKLSFLNEEHHFDSSSYIQKTAFNLTTNWGLLSENLSSSLKSYDEALKSITEGMSYEEALEMAKQTGVSLSEFRRVGEEFFLDSPKAIQSYIDFNTKVFDELTRNSEKLKDIAAENIELPSNPFEILATKNNQDLDEQEQLKLLKENGFKDNFTDTEILQIVNTYNEYASSYREAIEEGSFEGTISQYIFNEIDKLSEEYNIAKEVFLHSTAETFLTVGNLIGFYQALGEAKLKPEDLHFIKQGQFDKLSEEGKEIFAPFIEQYSKTLNDTRQEILSQVQEKFFSENEKFITATQANKNVLASLASSGVLAEYSTDAEGNITYKIIENISESLWASALSAAGATTKEINELLVDFYENKNNEVDSSVAKHSALLDVIENIDNLTPEILESVANILNITIDEVISTYGLQANEDGTYDASQNFIQSLLSQFKIGVTSEIEDSLNDYLNNIISIASSGIEGSATNTEIETLQNYLNEQGQNIELKTFKTAEGLKLTEDSVYEIYYALSQIDAVAAQSLLEGISEQMEEWEGHSIDVAAAYGKIRDIKKDIENYNKSGDTARLNLAKQELAVWEQITLEKAKDEDNFDFMNQDLEDLNNPITFYESSAKAFEALGEASSSGYMGVEEYVNMLRFMGNMLDEESQRMALGGRNAAEAIRLGLSALKGVDGELKVNLSGLDFGITGLTEGMEGGIEEMAKSQIAWIDAQIAMLRGLTMLDTVDKLDDPSDQNVVLDYVESFIGDFEIVSKELGNLDLSEALANLAKDPEALLTFFNSLWDIIEQNDPATAKEEIVRLIRETFNLTPEDLVTVKESDNELIKGVVSDKLSDLINVENWEEALPQDTAETYAKTIAEALGFDEHGSLMALLQAEIEGAGDTLSLNKIVEWFAANGVFKVGEDGSLELDIEATLKMRETKAKSEQNGVRTESLLDTDTPNYTTGENITVTESVITSDVAKINTGEIEFTEESEVEQNNNFSEATEDVNKLGTAAEDTGESSKIASAALALVKGGLEAVSSATKNSSSRLRSFTAAVGATSSLTTKYNVLAKIVEQINKLPTSPRYVGTASASGNIPSSNLGSSSSPPSNGEPDPNNYSSIDDYLEALRQWREAQSVAKGNALAAGTLMGELGPELVVSGGRYYVVGQNGAEFVNLPSDAIVFNHLQTKRLLESGHINSTGDPVTNERNAVAWATGNVNGGPAMASASDVIAQLLELRAFWQGILEMSAQDFAKAGGGGKGGGGGGEDNKAYVADLERWYNLLRQIANLEQKITLEQAKRQNMLNGYDYVDSLENELDQLKRQEKAYRDLSALQKSYYDTRRQDLLNSDYSKIFTYTSDGLMQYHEGENIGFDILAKLQETDANGQMKMNATEQLAYLESIGFDTSVLKVTKEGEDVDSETEMVQNFFDNVQAWMDELDGLYDSYNEALINVEEAIAAQNAIQQEYIDNQLSLEQQVLTAIIDREQAAIDAAQDEIDAIQEASDNFINGLNDTLKREKDMYQTNNEQAETERLQRQLAILQRTGGSANEIRALEEQLESRYQDAYFDSMQDEIDAIQAASENQIEKLQEQVDIAVEALEYQKANGLLWNEVYEIMNNWDANAITQFVMEFTKAFKEQSALQNQEQAKETLMSAEKWDAAAERQKQTEMWDQYFRQAMEQYGQTAATNAYSSAKTAYDRAYQATEGTVEQKHAAGMAAAKIEFEKSKAEIDRVTSGVSNGGGGNSSGETYPYGKVSEISRKETNVLTHEGPAIATIKYALKKLGYYKGEINEKYGTEVYNALVAFQKANKIDPDGIVGEETKKAFKLKGYSLGGLVDYTGLAMVHGTPQKPESYLNAEQTQELRSLLDEARALNSVSHSISNLNRLRQVWQTELFNQISSKEQSHQDAGDLIFEDVDINITSGVINNQAEAAQLGRTMWNEFINVAKKTGNLTLSRR